SQFVIPLYRVAALRMAENQCLNQVFSDDRRRRRPVVQHPNVAEELSGSKSNRLLLLAGDLGVAGNNDEEGSGGLTLPNHGLARCEAYLVDSAGQDLKLALAQSLKVVHAG